MVSRGFSLIELLVVVAVVALLVGIVTPALSSARRAGIAAVCASNLRQAGVATGAYARDADGRFWSLSWRRREAVSRHRDLNFADSTRTAAGAQVIDLIRAHDFADMPALHRRAGFLWLPTVRFGHLTLRAYTGGSLLVGVFVCPADRERLAPASDPRAWRAGAIETRGAQDVHWHEPYASTYTPVPASYDPNQTLRARSPRSDGLSAAAMRLRNTSMDGYLWGEDQIETRRRGAKLGGVRHHETAHPAQKVLLFDEADRHHAREDRHYALPGARQPLLFVDGSVRTLAVDDANPGWRPERPSDPDGARFPVAGAEGLHATRFRWTRGGMAGIDFGGRELNTGQRDAAR